MTELLPLIQGVPIGANKTVLRNDYILTAQFIQRFDLTFEPGCTLSYTGAGEPFLLAQAGAKLICNGLSCEKLPTFFVCANQPGCYAENAVLGKAPTTPPGSIGGGACAQRGGTNFVTAGFDVGVVSDYPAFAQECGFKAMNWKVLGSTKQASFRGDNDGVTEVQDGPLKGAFVTPTGIVISGGEWWQYNPTVDPTTSHDAQNVQGWEFRQASVTVCGGAILHGNIATAQGTQRTGPLGPFQDGENGTVILEDCTLCDMPNGAAGVAVRFGGIFQYSKSKTIFRSTLPIEKIVVSGGGRIVEVA